MTKKLFAIRKDLRPAQIVSVLDEAFEIYEKADDAEQIACIDANGNETSITKEEILDDIESIRSYLAGEEARRAEKVENAKMNQPSALKRFILKITAAPEPNDVEVLCDHWYSWREENIPAYRMFLPCYKESDEKFFYVYRSKDDTVKVGETAKSTYTSLRLISDRDQSIDDILAWIEKDLNIAE